MKNLDEIRNEIDNIDHELVALFQMRMSLAGEVANYKIANNLPVLNPAREKEILDRLTPEGELGPFTKDFLESIFDLSRKYQHTVMAQEE